MSVSCLFLSGVGGSGPLVLNWFKLVSTSELSNKLRKFRNPNCKLLYVKKVKKTLRQRSVGKWWDQFPQ